MTDPHPEVVAHYEVYNEADRLIKDNRLEFLRTAEIFERYVLPPPAVVVDIGGGPGVYATWLAQKGYRVHLFDVVPRHIDAARQADDTGRLTAELADPAFRQIVDRVLIDGQHRNPTRHPHYFTTAYFHRPEELPDEVQEAGFTEVEILAVEGIGWAVPRLELVLDDDEARGRLLDLLRRIESEPALLGASPHLLAVARPGPD